MADGRVLAVWCLDWPVVAGLMHAAGRSAEPAAVFRANRVVAGNAAARAEGIRTGMRRRDAQSRWPQLQVLPADPDRDARLFEPIAAAIEEQLPGIEVLRPGLLVCSAWAAARLRGSEEAVAEQVVALVESWGVDCQVGIADTLTVAVLAARRYRVVPAGEDAAFCAPLPIAELAREASLAPPERAELVGLLQRLGITTLGAFAALPQAKVVQRFGADGLAAHRVARGLADRGMARRQIPEELAVQELCDPPLERVDTAAFLARALATRFHQQLADAGLACTRLAVSARTDRGREFSRVWRAARPLTAEATADRVRWQLDGWLTSGRTRVPPRSETAFDDDDVGPGAITLLRLEPIEVIGSGRVQYGLWGSDGQDDHRAGWAFSRIQGLLGPEAVLTPVRSGGRGPDDRITLVPWGEEKLPERDPDAPWPGQLPAPSPAHLLTSAVEVLDETGRAVRLTSRGLLTGDPSLVLPLADSAAEEAVPIVSWAGPWLLDERWWAVTEAVNSDRATGAVRTDPASARAGPPGPGSPVLPGWPMRPGRARRLIAHQDADDRREAAVAAHAVVPDDSVASVPAEVSQVLTAPALRAARVQVLTRDGDALLLGLTPSGWQVEGVYD